MEKFDLDKMVKGWFVGDFSPTALKTQACEVAIKAYKKGDAESKHHHKIATEITAIVSGRVRMMDKEFSSGDIIVLKPGEATDFLALEDTLSVVAKVPGAQNDKYLS